MTVLSLAGRTRAAPTRGREEWVDVESLIGMTGVNVANTWKPL